LVAVFGKRCRNATKENALDHVFGWTIGNDVSERDWQKSDRTMYRSKNADTFKPMGPWIETDVNLDAMVTTVRLNGKVVDEFKTNNMIFDAPTYEGRYVNWGIREFGMAAAMNGMALHGGIIPYGGTFMVFSDYSRPAIRLGALMGVRAIHVLTHDSIGLGEDGPTHQPVEHLAALRAIPNLLVFRPADTVEAMECWQAALEHKHAPSALALSRQKTPAVRTMASDTNLSAKGAYEIRAARGEAKVTLFGTGTELALALAAADVLEAEGTPTRVVSVPCFELFFQQPKTYQDSVIGRGTVRVAVEAAVQQGWERFIGEDGAFVGMTGFGASAPAEVLYEKFGITTDAVVAAVKGRL
jgi:transketolase